MKTQAKTSRRESLRFSNFGFSTILLSFVMICGVCFSALSLLSTYSDYKLSQTVANKTTLYYEAKQSAYARLSDLEMLMCNTFLSTYSEEAYYQALLQSIDTLDAFQNETLELQVLAEGDYRLSFREPIAEGQYLLVEVVLTYPTQDSDTFYRLLTWRSVYDTQAPEDTYLNLIE